MQPYLFLAVLSMLGYAAQSVFMAPYYRRLDPLAATTARGISLGIAMLPLLFLGGWDSICLVAQHPGLLAAASLLAVFGNWASAIGYRYLPVSVALALQDGGVILFVTLIGVFYFAEPLAMPQMLAMLLLAGGNIVAAVQRGNGLAFDRRALKGVAFSLAYAVLLSAAFAGIAALSRAAGAFATGYFWEVTIGFFSLPVLLARARRRKELSRISTADFVGILGAAAPTTLGTACYALAVTFGPLAVVTAVGAAAPAFAAVLSWSLYRERLTIRQLSAVAMMMAAIVLLAANA